MISTVSLTGKSFAQGYQYYPGHSYDNIYFVDPENGDDGWDGLYPTPQGGSSGPFATLTHAMDVAGALVTDKDLIILREGTYKEEHDPQKCYPGYKPEDPYPPQAEDCNLGYPEDFPIYWNSNVTIQAYIKTWDPFEFEEAVLSTKINCNEDIIRPLHKNVSGFTEWGKPFQGQWKVDSDPDYSQIIGVVFETNSFGWAAWGSG